MVGSSGEVVVQAASRQEMSGLGAARARSSRRGKRTPRASMTRPSAWRVAWCAASARGPARPQPLPTPDRGMDRDTERRPGHHPGPPDEAEGEPVGGGDADEGEGSGDAGLVDPEPLRDHEEDHRAGGQQAGDGDDERRTDLEAEDPEDDRDLDQVERAADQLGGENGE